MIEEKHKHLIILTLAAIAIPMVPTGSVLFFLGWTAEVAIFYHIYKLIKYISYFMLYVVAFFIYLFILYKFYYSLFI